MRKINMRIRTQTPIWTGSSKGYSTSLKMSGVMGGLRHTFEALIRKFGGHTCNITNNITNSTNSCIYEKESSICPACAIFGTTGISRAFKLNLDLPTVSVNLPETDNMIPNRNHKNEEYKFLCGLDSWIASIIGTTEQIIKDHDQARRKLLNIKVAFSSEVANMPVIITRNIHEINIEKIIKYLLLFQSKYSGLGAKVRQGWGMFELIDVDKNQIKLDGESELIKLIAKYQYNEVHDTYFPNAKDMFAFEWQVNEDQRFNWDKKYTRRHPYKELGFALNFRFRRFIKFYKVDERGDLPIDQQWKNIIHGSPWDGVPWKKSIAFVRVMFGKDNAGKNDKHAGLVGTSHLYQKDGNWFVKFFGRIPESYKYRSTGQKLTLDYNEVTDFLRNNMEENILNGVIPETRNELTGGNL